MDMTTITTPEAAMQELKLQSFLEMTKKLKPKKKARRGTPGAFGKCKNWPKEAYKAEYIKNLKADIVVQEILMGEANPNTVKQLEAVTKEASNA